MVMLYMANIVLDSRKFCMFSAIPKTCMHCEFHFFFAATGNRAASQSRSSICGHTPSKLWLRLRRDRLG